MVSSNKKLAASETQAVSEGESATESIPQADIVPAAAGVARTISVIVG